MNAYVARVNQRARPLRVRLTETVLNEYGERVRRPVNLADVTAVHFTLRREPFDTLLVDNFAGTVTDAAAGDVEMAWDSSHLVTAWAGAKLLGHVRLTRAGGATEIVPVRRADRFVVLVEKE